MKTFAALAAALTLTVAACGGGSSASGTWTARQEQAFKAQQANAATQVGSKRTGAWLDCALHAAEKTWPNHFDYTTASDTEVIVRLSDACD
jgi:hypothetical protein